jgi:hypothetical protein
LERDTKKQTCKKNQSLIQTQKNNINKLHRGKLPASLAHLKMLTIMNMSHNQLEESIPDLSTGVQVIDSSHNHLSTSFPQSFGEIGLYYLLLSNNFLSVGIPTDLCNMVSMEVIIYLTVVFQGSF